jgi:phospholipid/cholesterol/gamma-HCH transport system substrate-binding protein
MPRQIDWKELTGGIIAVAVIVGLTLAILVYARVGGLRGKKVTLYVVTNEAKGVLAGTEVWLAGNKQGLVKDVSFRPPTTDPLERLIIKTEFLEDALPNVRRDSYAQVRPAGSFIGSTIVYIEVGSQSSPQLHDGDTVHTRRKGRISALAGDITRIGPELSALSANISELNARMKNPTGTIGSARARGIPRMPDISARMSRLAAKATQGSGTMALASRTNLMARASHSMAAADSIQTLMSSNKSSLGRFRRDTTLVTKAKGVLAELDTLRSFAANPVGTIAAAHSDSVLSRELNQTHALLDSLIKDIKKRPKRYIKL